VLLWVVGQGLNQACVWEVGLTPLSPGLGPRDSLPSRAPQVFGLGTGALLGFVLKVTVTSLVPRLP
jgi:hypothetical protein